MKIRIDRQVFAEAVSWAARSLPNRPSVPILNGMLIKANADGVTISSFDYDTSGIATLPAEVTEEGVALVHGRLLNDLTKGLPNRPVEMETKQTNVELVCGSARFTLQMLPVDDYPELPEMPTASGSVESSLFTHAVSQVAVAAGRDELLPVFTGIKIEIDDKTLSMLATDRYRMALKEITWEPASAEASGSALVPAKVLSDVTRSLKDGTDITLAVSHPEIGEGIFGIQGTGSSGERELTTRLLSGEFPKVRHLMDIVPKVVVRCKTDELTAAVKLVATVAERNTPLRMTIDSDSIALEAADGDQAQGTQAIAAVIENHDDGAELALTAAGFNPSYLQDALGAISQPYVYFAFTAPGKPCLIQGLEKIDSDPAPDYKHVIMLMRLPN